MNLILGECLERRLILSGGRKKPNNPTILEKVESLKMVLNSDSEEQRAMRVLWIMMDMESRIDRLEESWPQKISRFFNRFVPFRQSEIE